MLTVKLIENNGREQVHCGIKNIGATPTGAGVCYEVTAFRQADDDAVGSQLNFSGEGVLYVMNEGGQTVAKYILG